MSSSTAETQIALGVIASGPDAYWLERRPDAKHLAGMLAFPGGKCDPDETPFAALCRELSEELGIVVDTAELLLEIPWVYAEKQPVKRLRLWVFQVTAWRGEIRGCEGQGVHAMPLDCHQRQIWLDALPPANRGIVAALCLPPQIAISVACAPGVAGFQQWILGLAATAHDLARRFGVGGALMQLRPGRTLTTSEWQQAVATVQELGLPVLVNAELATARTVGADGVHLSRARLAQADQDELAVWQASGGWVTAAVHHPAEMGRANEARVDAVLISPVQPTESHPEMAALGWAEFAALSRTATMPTFALGGMTPQYITQVRASGGQGIAAIRAFWRTPADGAKGENSG